MNPQLATVQHRQFPPVVHYVRSIRVFMKLLGSPLTTRCRRAPSTMKLGFPHSCAHSVCKFNTRFPGTCLMAQRGSTPTLTANNQDGLQLGREQQSDGRVFTHNFYRRLAWALDSRYSSHTAFILSVFTNGAHTVSITICQMQHNTAISAPFMRSTCQT